MMVALEEEGGGGREGEGIEERRGWRCVSVVVVVVNVTFTTTTTTTSTTSTSTTTTIITNTAFCNHHCYDHYKILTTHEY